jgi:predicted DNA-binding transcriptional regulator YafY
MSLQGTIKRYFLIVSLTRQNQKPSSAEILDMLHSEGFKISKRTLDRDIEDIRNEFGIELVYDKIKRGYFIDVEQSFNLDYILRFFELSISAQVMIDSFKEAKEALHFVSFDSSDNLIGVHWLRNIMMAIRTRRIILFEHTSFQTGETGRYEVHPYFLKEYKGRWFLFGYVPSYKDFRIFGIERIDKLKLADEYFKPIKNLNPAEIFENIIGISLLAYQEQPIQTIVISTTAEQGRYMKSLPWHPSFTLLVDTDDEFRFSLTIMPNNEFIQLILNSCNRITVLEPQWLRDNLKNILTEAASNY